MLRACILDFAGGWDTYLYLVEFTYNNSYQATNQMTPFEVLYGWRCRTLIYWEEEEVGKCQLLGLDLRHTPNEAIQKISKRILTIQSRQKSYADIRRKNLKFAGHSYSWRFTIRQKRDA